ncbi:MAG: alpha/beta hydrolase-fold protein [Flavobacteriaceae bacterium]|nr:alpha/beta hydrolase-fold protein [Flavobacteriaceae bacterium]
MKFFFLAALLCLNLAPSQTIYESLESGFLGATRELKIQLPRNYEDNPEKYYPLIIVFDGDYLFEVVAGNVDYYSYWQDMPEAIVVGVNQTGSREQDCNISLENYMPSKTGAQFYDFIENELLIYMSENYRSLNFRVAVGHGETANFMNYFLFNKRPIFNAFVALSPSFSYTMEENLIRRLGLENTSNIFYYLSTAALDIKQNKKQIDSLNTKISNLENKNLVYAFDNFEDANHYNLVAQSIPKALQSIFLVFQPISKSEYKEYILTLETSPVDYLIEKYDTIEDFFGIKKQILVNDIRAIAAAIQKNKQFEYFQDLGKIASKQHPYTVLGSFFMARYYEETGKPKKAMNIYKSAYTLEGVDGYTKEDMFERANQIKQEYGY